MLVLNMSIYLMCFEFFLIDVKVFGFVNIVNEVISLKFLLIN